jgi:hypothetical protein
MVGMAEETTSEIIVGSRCKYHSEVQLFGCMLCRSSALGSYDWGGKEFITKRDWSKITYLEWIVGSSICISLHVRKIYKFLLYHKQHHVQGRSDQAEGPEENSGDKVLESILLFHCEK